MIFLKPPKRISGFHGYADPKEGLPILEIGEISSRSDWKVPKHQHQGFEVHLQLKGSTRWKIGNKIELLVENSAYLTSPQTQHLLLDSLQTDIHFYYVVFSGGVVPKELAILPPWTNIYSIHQNAQSCLKLFQNLIQEVVYDGSWRKEIVTHQLKLLCFELSRVNEKSSVQSNFQIHQAALQARDLLSRSPERDWPLTQVASLVGLSVPHLLEVFKKAYGITPKQFLLNERLTKSKTLLQSTDQSITEIAHELGFSSAQHFSSSYRKHFKVTPRSDKKK